MKYTRYNYKAPKKKNNFIIVITLTLIAAIALGTMFSKLLPKNNANAIANDKATKVSLKKDIKLNKASTIDTKAVSTSNIKNYVAIQCGVFSTKASALLLKDSLKDLGVPFIIEDGKLNRVLLGVYPKEGTDSVVKQLKAKKIAYAKINFQLVGKDLTSAQTNEMISADIKILNKLSEKNTKAIQTVELKKWMVSLKGAEQKSNSYGNLKQIKAYLNALPQELKKEKTEAGYVYIYKFIKQISKT
ncbi:SPOR domain-containing protein [Clostridium psychrophilum]|uniref:SPOR domain-containing protein n=1 Tax=Clostridium psychrophilum TaxID=132926 RepID=UPI001C0C3D25|nr:SPOR domain-containing protein [Clostridium psychrophilum]MBU3181312.1 SPOR domain-containing protein [Clostridium psychrophilum]